MLTAAIRQEYVEYHHNHNYKRIQSYARMS